MGTLSAPGRHGRAWGLEGTPVAAGPAQVPAGAFWKRFAQWLDLGQGQGTNPRGLLWVLGLRPWPSSSLRASGQAQAPSILGYRATR